MKNTKRLLIALAIMLFSLIAIAATAGEQDTLDVYASTQYQTIQPANTPRFPAARIRTSLLPNGNPRPNSESIVIVLMGDGFSHNQYYRSSTGAANGTGTRENPDEDTFFWHANRVITSLEETPPFDAFKHLFTPLTSTTSATSPFFI